MRTRGAYNSSNLTVSTQYNLTNSNKETHENIPHPILIISLLNNKRFFAGQGTLRASPNLDIVLSFMLK